MFRAIEPWRHDPSRLGGAFDREISVQQGPDHLLKLDVYGVMELLRTCDPATTGQCVAVQGECVDARGQSGQSVEADLSAGEKAYLLIQVYGTVRQNSRFVLEVEEVLP